MKIETATLSDIPELVDLVQSCFRGSTSKKGWTTEDHFVEGDRTSPKMLEEDMTEEGAVMFKAVEEGRIIGCVISNLREAKMYIGIISVRPDLQGGGIGKKLFERVEERARECGCKALTLTVFALSGDLVAYYERRGFKKTGNVVPFNPREGRLKIPVDVIELEKELIY